MDALRRMDGGGSPEGPERSEGAAQRLDASTAVRHPDSVPPNLTRQPSNNPITAPSDTGSALTRRRYAERRARGDCTSCGKPAHGAAECQACRYAARARYDARRAAGVCVKCKTPTYGGTAYCAPCAVAKEGRRDREAEYAAKRARYADRRARGRCVECDAPSPGVARCEPCSRKHREGSGAFRGIPLWDPSWTVIEIATGEALGTFDSEADVALCLAFAKLGRDQVEVLCDASPMSSYTAPPW